MSTVTRSQSRVRQALGLTARFVGLYALINVTWALGLTAVTTVFMDASFMYSSIMLLLVAGALSSWLPAAAVMYGWSNGATRHVPIPAAVTDLSDDTYRALVHLGRFVELWLVVGLTLAVGFWIGISTMDPTATWGLSTLRDSTTISFIGSWLTAAVLTAGWAGVVGGDD
jgi:hypothetical protein